MINLRLTGVLCGLVMLGPIRASGQETSSGGPYATLGNVAAGWKAHVQPFLERGREARVEASKQYFRDIGWDHILYLCRENSPGVKDGTEADLQALVDAKLRSETEPSIVEIIRLFDNPTTCVACLKAAAKHVSHHRAEFRDRPEAAELGAAFLRLADSGGLPAGVDRNMEAAAAFFLVSDELMARMMGHCRSGNPTLMAQGVRMLSQARDPRAPDSLIALVAWLARNAPDSKPLRTAMGAAGTLPDARALDILTEVFDTTRDPETRRQALRAMALTQSPAVHPVLLAQYGPEPEGIADSTYALPEESDKYRFYYELWFVTRLAEPGLIDVLEQGPSDRAAVALDLLDRASRFGLPATRDTLYQALRAFESRDQDTDRERIAAMMARYRSYPERRSTPH